MKEGYVCKTDRFTVCIQSTAGIETSCYVREWNIGFDLGCLFGKMVWKQFIFISHGHMDHIYALPAHAQRRHLFQLKPPVYYVPQSNVAQVKQLMTTCQALQGASIPFQVIGYSPSDTISIDALRIVPFPTVHRVDSCGFLVYESTKVLVEQYRNADRTELQKASKAGAVLYEYMDTLQLAYTGDTTIDVFKNEPLLCQVPILIMEMTFLGPKVSKQKAYERGHIHLHHLLPYVPQMTNAHILFMHFSARYTFKDAIKALKADFPKQFIDRVQCAFSNQ